MKAIALLTLAMLPAIISFSQKSSGEHISYVKYEGTPSSGTIKVSSTGFAKKKPESLVNAVENAFHNLLFIGIPGSQYDLPMIKNESEVKNNTVLSALKSSGYKGYIIDNTTIGEQNTSRKELGIKGKTTTCSITINVEALRRYLEQQGVIRKFGI